MADTSVDPDRLAAEIVKALLSLTSMRVSLTMDEDVVEAVGDPIYLKAKIGKLQPIGLERSIETYQIPASTMRVNSLMDHWDSAELRWKTEVLSVNDALAKIKPTCELPTAQETRGCVSSKTDRSWLPRVSVPLYIADATGGYRSKIDSTPLATFLSSTQLDDVWKQATEALTWYNRPSLI